MKRKDHYVFVFSLTDFDIDPSEITLLTGLQPRKAGKKGEWYRIVSIASREIQHSTNTWVYQEKYDGQLLEDEPLERFIELIDRKIRIASPLLPTYSAGFTIVLYYYTRYNAGWWIPESVMKRIAALNATLSFELYALNKPSFKEKLNDFLWRFKKILLLPLSYNAKSPAFPFLIINC